MPNDLKTLHGAELYATWMEKGGTKEGWVELIAPKLMKAGAGPMYRMDSYTYAELFYYYVNLSALDGPEHYDINKRAVISAEALQKLKTILAAI